MRDWSDPGWPLRVFLGLVPLWARFADRKRRGGQNALLALRTLYVSFVAVPFHLLFVVSFLADGVETSRANAPRTAGVLVAIAGALLLLVSVRTHGREVPLGRDEVVAAFRAVFFLRFALANAAVLVGFVAFFLGGKRLWIYMIGMGFGLIGLLAMAPTKVAIDEWDGRRQGGSPRPSLGELLSADE